MPRNTDIILQSEPYSCPQCSKGKKYVEIVKVYGKYKVVCNHCKFETATGHTKFQAAVAWNNCKRRNEPKQGAYVFVKYDKNKNIVYTADSVAELAIFCKVKPESIMQTMSRAKRLNHSCIYEKIYVGDDWD